LVKSYAFVLPIFQEAAGFFDGEERRDPIVHWHNPQTLTTQPADDITSKVLGQWLHKREAM
jgi:hypothetical protein